MIRFFLDTLNVAVSLVTVNGVKVVKADVPTSLSIIVHAVDKVIPTIPPGRDIDALLSLNTRFSVFRYAVKYVELTHDIQETGLQST